MKHTFIAALCAFMLLVAGSLSCEEKGLRGTPDELKLYGLLNKGRFTEARQSAEVMLRRNGDSYAALYAMALITRKTETNLPKGYYYLEKARNSFEKVYGKTPPATTPWKWHSLILDELIATSEEMELHEKTIEYLKANDDAYIPPRTASYAWPLMQLGRLDEARRVIHRALKESKVEDDRLRALNTRAAIEYKLDNRKESYAIYRSLIRDLRDESWQVLLRSNCAGAAARLLKYDEAEKEYINSASYGTWHAFVTNPWQGLLGLYTGSARYDEACGALKKMLLWGLDREPYLDQQCEGEELSSKAEFLLACGYPEQAYLISRRLVAMPDRIGYSSTNRNKQLGSTLFFHFTVNHDYQQLLRERLVQRDPAEVTRALWALESLRLESALLKPRIKRIIMSQCSLYATLIPGHPDGVGLPRWYASDLAPLVGKGPMDMELGRIRRSYRHRELLDAYFLELEGELAGKGLDRRRALELLGQAQQKLPPGEKLILARSYAETGRLKEKCGELESALLFYEKAYRICPGLFRHMKIQLPVAIRAAGNETELADIGKRLARSPRFRIWEGAFVITLGASGGRIHGTLLDHLQNGMCTVSTARTGKSGPDADAFLEEFHLKVFSAPLDTSLSELNSLDGTNLRDDRMRGNLNELLFPGQKKK